MEVIMSDETLEQTFQVTAPPRLKISNIRGSIVIQAGEPGVIAVKAVKHGNSDSSKHINIEMTQEADGSVRVETRSNEAFLGFLSHPPKVDYTVHVPQNITLDASAISSSVNVSGLEGDFKFNTVSGDVVLASLTGPIKLNAVSGDVSATRLAGDIKVETVSGDVRLAESSFPSADGTTVSGELVIQTPLAEGPYRFSSVSGDVHVVVPTNTHCTGKISSVSGKIRSSLPVTVTRLGNGSKVTEIQGGGTKITLNSVSGDLSIETEGVPATAVPAASPFPAAPVPPIPPVPPAPPSPPVPPAAPAAPPLSTAEILQRIELGEMTVEDALKLMKDQS
jgi:hypothetical protein